VRIGGTARSAAGTEISLGSVSGTVVP